MQKKFFDVIPPKYVKIHEEEVKIKPQQEAVLLVKKKKKIFWVILGSVILLLLFLEFVYSALFSGVDIKIWPKTESISLSETIIIDLNANQLDLTANILPGRIVSNEKFGSEEFKSTGTAQTEGKARGTITVYNTYSTSSRTLVPSRFVSADGKLFWSTKKITIPGSYKKGGKLVPGETEVEIEAAEAGPEYNIKSTTFALPALAGTALYTSIYARSYSDISGGHRGEVNQVTRDDFDKAEDFLLGLLNNQSKADLRGSLAENIILLDESITQEILERKSSHQIGAGTDTFTVSAKVKSEAFVFNQQDIDTFILEKASSNKPKDTIIIDGSLEVSYSVSDIDMTAGLMVINLNIKVKIYDNIDLTKIERSLLGKSISESRIFLDSLPRVLKAELNYRPFIKMKIPKNESKVEITFQFD